MTTEQGDEMLVLSRKKDEQIHIGDNIVVTVVRSGRNVVSIGIDAPRDVQISRPEAVERVANRDAA
jgi:carbon storage regulator